MYRPQIGPGRVAESLGHLTRKSGVLGSKPGLATYFRFSFRFFKKDSSQLLAKVCARVLVNRLGGLSLPRKSVVRLTDRPDMTLDVYRGRKTTMQQQQQQQIEMYRQKDRDNCQKNILFFSEDRRGRSLGYMQEGCGNRYANMICTLHQKSTISERKNVMSVNILQY